MKKTLGLIVITALGIFFAGFASAQFEDLISGTITLSISPEYPGSKQLVRVTAESFSTDLNRANIIWVLDGKNIKHGLGEKKVEFTTGPLGTSHRLQVIAQKNEGGTLQAEIRIRPAEIDLLVQNQTYTPPFYRGRTLHSSESPVTIIALPHFVSGGTRLIPTNLIYTWVRNGDPMLDQSGAGKNTLTIRGAKIFGRDIIGVTAATRDKTISARANTIIETIEPEVRFYENRELLGTNYSQALEGSFNLTSQELSFRAEPFFVSLPEFRSEEVDYRFTINGKAIRATPENPRVVILRQEGGSGAVRLTLALKNPKRLLQEAVASIFLNFGGGEFSPTNNQFFQ